MDSLELTAAVIVASRHRDEWTEVYNALEQGETFAGSTDRQGIAS